MANFIFDFLFPDNYIYDDQKITISNGFLFLRKHDPVSMQYEVDGVYETSELETFDFNASGIQKLYSLHLIADIPSGTNILFQVSVDKGITWQRFDGTVWLSDGQFSSVEEISQGFPLLQFNPSIGKVIRLKIRLETDSQQENTPKIFCLIIYYDLRYSYFEDLKRSLKRHLESKMRCHLTAYKILQSGSNSVSLDLSYNAVEVIGAYNKTIDPYLTNNILQSWSGVNPVVVNLTQTVSSGEIVFIEYDGYPTVKIAGADYYFIEVKDPEILIVGGDSGQDNRITTYTPMYEYNSFLKKYRLYFSPIYVNSRVSIISIDNSELGSLQTIDGIFDILQYGSKIMSVATGDVYTVLSITPVVIDDRVTQNIRMKKVDVIVSGRKHLPIIEEVNRVEEIVLSINDFIHKYLEVSIT